MTPSFLACVLAGRRDDAAAELGVELPDGFPSDGEERFLGLRLRQMREDERYQAWCPHVIVLGGQMIGHTGFHGPPGVNSNEDPTAVELGYRVYEPYRGRGFATEAVRRMMERAEELGGIRRFVLSIAPDNDPSLAIARKLGFVRTGQHVDKEDGLELVFSLNLDHDDAGP